MSWETVRLGNVISTLKGFAFKSSHYTESGHPIVRASNFTMDSISDDDLKYYSYEEALQYEKYSLKKSDVLIQTVGSWEYNPNSVVGKVVRVPRQLDGALLNQNIVKIIPDSTIDNGFLYYRLKCTDFAKYNIGNAVGAANQASITLDTIRDFYFKCPNIITQKRISNVLSAYDDLIENNHKQIKLLEEAAQRLYKEWFVDLRFPGHETTHIIDGIPEEWSAGVLDDIAYESGKNEKKERRDNYDYYLPIDCLPKQSLGYTETADISLAESSLVSFVKDDIVFGAMRPYFHKVVVARDSGLTRSTCFVLNSRQNEFWAYLTMLMFSKDTVDYATQISVGTTMPYARWKDLRQMPIIIPSKMIAENFQYVVKPIIKKIGCLSKAIIYLSQARDRLLPKLMNGELEV